MIESMVILITLGVALCLLLYGVHTELFVTDYIYETQYNERCETYVHVWRIYFNCISVYQGEWSSVEAIRKKYGENSLYEKLLWLNAHALEVE